MDYDSYPTILQVDGLRRYRTAERFAKEFPEEMCDHKYHLPLDRFCTEGGSGSDVEGASAEVETFTRYEVTRTYHFEFVESYYGGCRDIDYHCRHVARLEFRYNRKNGELKLWGGTAKRVYEPDEF